MLGEETQDANAAANREQHQDLRCACAAYIREVEPDSPADDAGFTPGCLLTSVDGHPIRDILDWRWWSSDDFITVGYIDTHGDSGEVELEREPGYSWGFEFEGAVFDDIRQCENACTFCFVRQLPDRVRDTLTVRDDDFRLSFLQGTFVTFTNFTDADTQRILEQHISPLRYSLHAVTPELRRKIIGKNAEHGIEVATYLMDRGIVLHGQIVLMPGVNDGDELQKTLTWAYGQRNMASVGIVPVGFTKHQTAFTRSFDTPELAGAVIECVSAFQKRAMKERGTAWVYASDEFYRNAFPESLLQHLPPTEFYGDFDLFEDGIGIVRSFIDDWLASKKAIDDAAQIMKREEARVLFVCGCAQKEFFGPLLAQSSASSSLVPCYVDNEYFGGNVDVTGLLCGCDIARAVKLAAREAESAGEPYAMAVIPEVVFNTDDLTLDDMHLEEIEEAAGLPMYVVSCEASGYMPQIGKIIESGGLQNDKAHRCGSGAAERR